MISAATRASFVNFLIKIIISRQFNISYTIIAVFQVNAMIKLSDKYNIHRVGGKTCADPEFFLQGGGWGGPTVICVCRGWGCPRLIFW